MLGVLTDAVDNTAHELALTCSTDAAMSFRKHPHVQQVSTMQATRGRTTDVEQQNLTVPAKKRSGFLADVAEVQS